MKFQTDKTSGKPSLSTNREQINSLKLFANKYQRPLLGTLFNIAVVLFITALPALAQQMPNPFGGSGTTKLANTGGNLMVIGTWMAFFVGLLSFVLIPIFIKFEWNYKKLIMSGITGLGGFIILGAIAYDIVNLNSVTISDPTIGR